MLEPHTPDRPDDLKQRYLQASAEQAIGPSEKVRRAALAHAQAVAAGAANEVTTRLPQAAANRSRWNTPLVASLAIASISALLALQFDRGESADKQVALGTRAFGYAAGGDTERAEKIIQEILAQPKIDPGIGFYVGLAYCILGKHEQALPWLEKSLEESIGLLTVLGPEPAFDPVRSDPRFQAILRKLGLQ